MTKYALLALLALLTVPGAALAQGGANTPNGGRGGDSAQFQSRKTEILQRLNHRITELQQRQSCVQAATTRQALQACLPKQEKQGQR